MKRHRFILAVVMGWMGMVAAGAWAKVSVPAIFSDNLVLQRGASVPVWGQADPGEAVEVTLAKEDPSNGVASSVIGAQTTADAQGKWMARLDLSQAPRGTYALLVRGANNELAIRNVLIGQVWLASGQSNMEWSVSHARDAKDEMEAGDFPEIRQFAVQKRIATTPTEALAGSWVVATPKTVGAFTAVGYFFARELHQKLDVPVGIIHSSWGGTRIEAWMSAQALGTIGGYDAELEAAERELLPEPVRKYEKDIAEWRANLPSGMRTTDAERPYAQDDFDDSGWKTIQAPGAIENAGMDVDGVVWFRRSFELPDAPQGDATLQLGVIDDYDITYINGVEVGETPPGTANAARTGRRYAVRSGVLRKGPNTIAVRVLDTGGRGGFMGPQSLMHLVVGTRTVALSGEWRVHHETSIEVQPLAEYMQKLPRRPGTDANMVTALYNGMIHPILPYAIAGAIWYQGESNAWGPGPKYAKLLATMIEDWRARWDQPEAQGGAIAGTREFPFYIVQLANFMEYSLDPSFTGLWPTLRQAQQEVADTIPHTGLAVTIDIGEEKDIHPRNKQDVGERLARIALAKTYGKDVEYSGPRLKEARVEDGKVVLTFSHTTGGWVVKPLDMSDVPGPSTRAALSETDTPVKGFALQDEEGHWHFARATIEGETVVVSADGVKHPQAIRYAFADNPVVNLYNGAGLPANPFEKTLDSK